MGLISVEVVENVRQKGLLGTYLSGNVFLSSGYNTYNTDENIFIFHNLKIYWKYSIHGFEKKTIFVILCCSLPFLKVSRQSESLDALN